MPHFEATVEFVPHLSTAHYDLGVVQQQQGHPDVAKSEYELALKYSTDATEIAQAHSNLGFLLIGLHDLKAAEEEFTAALQVNRDKQNSLLGRGMVEYWERAGYCRERSISCHSDRASRPGGFLAWQDLGGQRTDTSCRNCL